MRFESFQLLVNRSNRQRSDLDYIAVIIAGNAEIATDLKERGAANARALYKAVAIRSSVPTRKNIQGRNGCRVYTRADQVRGIIAKYGLKTPLNLRDNQESRAVSSWT